MPAKKSNNNNKNAPARLTEGDLALSNNSHSQHSHSQEKSPAGGARRHSTISGVSKSTTPRRQSTCASHSPSSAVAHSPSSFNTLVVSGHHHYDPNMPFGLRVEAAFNKFAVAEGGSHKVLSVNSLQNALYLLDLNPSTSRVNHVLDTHGYSRRGLMLSEFSRFASSFRDTMANLNSMMHNFEVLDTDQDDRISREEFIDYVGNLPPRDRIIGRSLEEVLTMLDAENTGYIYLRGFLTTLFTDLTEEEILAAMAENGFDPDREENDRKERVAKAQAKATERFEEDYTKMLDDERMLRTEIQAEMKEEQAEVDQAYTVLEEALVATEEERKKKAAEKEEERLQKEAEEEAERQKEEAERKAKEEEEKAKAAEEARKKKEEAEEAERKRQAQLEEQKQKNLVGGAGANGGKDGAQSAGAKDAPVLKPKQDSKEGGGCCVIQ